MDTLNDALALGPENWTGRRVSYAAKLLLTLESGTIVIVNRFTSHQHEETTVLNQPVGVNVWFLSASSPDLNPIEKTWSKIKQVLQSLETGSHEQLLDAIAHALYRVTPCDARNWVASCGYSMT